MCWKCEQHHTKLFWLDQYVEMKKLSKDLVKSGHCKNAIIDVELWLYKIGKSKYKTKEQIEERVLAIIMYLTVPRKHSGEKFIEQNLF
jgi:hypothetical protein